jgi:hypothetical protein
MVNCDEETRMWLKKEDRVRHPIKAEWGLGEVLEDSNGETVRVFFVGIGEKTLSLKHVTLECIPKDEVAQMIRMLVIYAYVTGEVVHVDGGGRFVSHRLSHSIYHDG